jgi:hypothetical protein
LNHDKFPLVVVSWIEQLSATLVAVLAPVAMYEEAPEPVSIWHP